MLPVTVWPKDTGVWGGAPRLLRLWLLPSLGRSAVNSRCSMLLTARPARSAAPGAALPQASPRLRLRKTRPPACTVAGGEGRDQSPSGLPARGLQPLPEPRVWGRGACPHAPASPPARSEWKPQLREQLHWQPVLLPPRAKDQEMPSGCVCGPVRFSQEPLPIASRLTPRWRVSARSPGPRWPPTATANSKKAPTPQPGRHARG